MKNESVEARIQNADWRIQNITVICKCLDPKVRGFRETIIRKAAELKVYGFKTRTAYLKCTDPKSVMIRKFVDAKINGSKQTDRRSYPKDIWTQKLRPAYKSEESIYPTIQCRM